MYYLVIFFNLAVDFYCSTSIGYESINERLQKFSQFLHSLYCLFFHVSLIAVRLFLIPSHPYLSVGYQFSAHLPLANFLGNFASSWSLFLILVSRMKHLHPLFYLCCLMLIYEITRHFVQDALLAKDCFLESCFLHAINCCPDWQLTAQSFDNSLHHDSEPITVYWKLLKDCLKA